MYVSFTLVIFVPIRLFLKRYPRYVEPTILPFSLCIKSSDVNVRPFGNVMLSLDELANISDSFLNTLLLELFKF
jgi:hypothetical protein